MTGHDPDSIRTRVAKSLAAAHALEPFNAMISIDDAAALAAAGQLDRAAAAGNAPGALHGVPFTVKDNIAVAGMRFTGGCPVFSEQIAQTSASVVDRLRAAGAVVIGKSNLHELAFGVTSNNATFGAVRNPFDPTRIAGGSSGGAAVSVASGAVPFAIATDTGGSVRIPAALCGVVGLRPSSGRYPGDGVMTLSHTRDTIGVLACDVGQAARVDAAVCGDAAWPALHASGLRLGVLRRPFFDDCEPALIEVVEAALNKLSRANVELIEVDASAIGALDAEIGFIIAAYETAQEWTRVAHDELGIGLPDFIARIASPDVRELFTISAAQFPAMKSQYQDAVSRMPQLRSLYERLLSQQHLDALVYPTTPLCAFPIGDSPMVLLNGREQPIFPTLVRHTSPASVAGVPSVSLPVGRTAPGLPVGLQVEAGFGQDRKLLAVCAMIERLLCAP